MPPAVKNECILCCVLRSWTPSFTQHEPRFRFGHRSSTGGTGLVYTSAPPADCPVAIQIRIIECPLVKKVQFVRPKPDPDRNVSRLIEEPAYDVRGSKRTSIYDFRVDNDGPGIDGSMVHGRIQCRMDSIPPFDEWPYSVLNSPGPRRAVDSGCRLTWDAASRRAMRRHRFR